MSDKLPKPTGLWVVTFGGRSEIRKRSLQLGPDWYVVGPGQVPAIGVQRVVVEPVTNEMQGFYDPTFEENLLHWRARLLPGFETNFIQL